MVIDLKMCRFDNVPWGFRLVGGADFEIPLTVVKVTEGSLAEEAGLRVDDVIVRINDEATSPMSHDEAHRVISSCGNVFFLGVQREDEESEKRNFFPISENLDRKLSRTPDSLIDASIQSQIDELFENQSHAINEEVLDPESKIEDEEIANLLSAEAEPEPEPEALEEQNVVGVNVNRVFPKPGVCNSSEVLRELKEEAIKTKLEKEQDKKKWTTFMQKPNRPIPKSKQQLEAEARAANAYKVKIVKNYKKPEPVRPPTPIPEPEPEPEVKEEPKAETPPPEVEEEPPTDSEVPNLEPTGEILSQEEPQVDDVQPDNSEETNAKVEENEVIRETSVAKEERIIESVDRDGKSPSESGSLREKTEEEFQLEQQLAHVQQQLLALSNLPSTIQSTLDAVTRQLSELLPTFKLQTRIVKEATPEVKEDVKQEEVNEVTATSTEEITTNSNIESIEVEEKSIETVETHVTQSYHEETTVQIESETKQEVTIQEIETSHRNIEEEQMEEEQNLKRKKENGVIEELQKQIEHKETQKRKKSKRMFGPLVPQERPLVLPGGRRWYRPKDAYNDEFIAETLTAQAELIAGTAVGHYKFESPLLGYDERLPSGTDVLMTGIWPERFSENNCGSVATQLEKRVNFMKYQKPEKKVDLDKSEVYKILHHLDKSPVRGIEVRPPVVVAEADVRRVVES